MDSVVSESAITAVQGVDLLADWRTDLGLTMNLPGTTVERVIISQSGGVNAGVGTINTGWRVGLIVEASVGEAEVPDPVAEPLAKWMWNARYHLSNNTLAWLYDDDAHIDVRVRRTMRQPGESLWLMLSPELSGATSLNYSAHVRTLLLLP